MSLAGKESVVDLVVVGAGGAGMAAALFAAIAGLDVLLLERTEFVGGTTAFSGGTAWVPNTHLAATVGSEDSRANAAAFLSRAVGQYGSEELHHSFLENGPAAIATLAQHSEVKFRAYPLHPDYMSELDGSTLCGRALEPLPFDGRRLGDGFTLIRPPIPEFTALGGMMVDRTDIKHLLNFTRSWASFYHAMGLLGRHAKDRLRHARGTRLVMGNALVARLLCSLRQRRVPVWLRAEVHELLLQDGRVDGVRVQHDGGTHRIRARHGVILASGGFNRHPRLRQELLPSAPTHTPGAPGHTGAAIELALRAGARLGNRNLTNAFWAPVSVRQRPDGSTAVFPHFILDRAKPGTVIVDHAGRRFVNESTSYHLIGRAMLEAHERAPTVPAYLIADARALKAYGLGMVRPGGRGLKPLLADGYLVRAPTLAELARKLEIDAAGLTATVTRMNEFARTGLDLDFHRGTTAYERNLGDPAAAPNPTMGPIAQAPFYAIRLYPGDIGASAGLVTDAQARVLTAGDRPLDGLYAVGNDMNSIMGGTYPGPGITIGPGLTFAFIAVQDAARRAAGTAADNRRASVPAGPSSVRERQHA